MDEAALLDGLTSAQQTAVTTDAAPLCILAGAGAGKTRALTRRIAYRVATGSAEPGHVLALTFTRKAAGELGERLSALGMRDRIAAGTFHGIAFAQLRRWWADRGETPPALLDRKGRLLSRLVAGRPGFDGIAVADVAAEIEWAQARLVSPATYEAAAVGAGRQPPVGTAAIAALFDRYIAEKQRRRVADFDDLLARCAEAIETDPGFGAAQRWRWRHLFVDEFQDANPLQYRLLLAWLGPRLDLCVVGDPNQAIYGWNGADPGLLTGVTDRWPTAEVVRLDANHRSTPQVVEAAAGALGLPQGSVSSTRPDGGPVGWRAYPSDGAEAHGVVAELRQAQARGLAWSHLAVLVRTNAQTAAFEAACRAAGIPCRVSGATMLLDEPAVKAAVADLRRRGRASLAIVIADLDEMATAGRDPAGRDPAEGGTAAGAGLDTLAGMARDFQRLDASASAAAFLSWVEAAARAEQAERTAATDAVTICTFHRAKGLEWPAVWVTGLERGLVPIGYATTPASEAEERRLLYVALTRAAQELRCSWAEQRRLGGRLVPREPSAWMDGIAHGADHGGLPEPEADASDTWRRRFTAERERLARRSEPGRSGRGRPRQPHGGSPVAGLDRDGAVLEALASWRASAARAAGVPTYVLLHDSTLAAVATARPTTIDELLAVPGLGPVKASRYGPMLLALVAQHRASA